MQGFAGDIKKLEDYGFISVRPKGEIHVNNQQLAKQLHKAIGLGSRPLEDVGFPQGSLFLPWLHIRLWSHACMCTQCVCVCVCVCVYLSEGGEHMHAFFRGICADRGRGWAALSLACMRNGGMCMGTGRMEMVLKSGPAGLSISSKQRKGSTGGNSCLLSVEV